MKDVKLGTTSKEWRLFAYINFVKGTYKIFGADDLELLLEQPGSVKSDGKHCTLSSGTSVGIKPIDTYLSENLFTEDTYIDAQYKHSQIVGRRMYIGNIKQQGRTYPDRMLRSPVNKFDTFPETNYIDVAVGDGDEITALESFGDRLFQFKKNKVYVINTGGEEDALEAEYNNAGISFSHQVCKTNTGLAWLNTSGLWIFDGENIECVTRHVESDGYGDDDSVNMLIGFDSRSNRIIFCPNTLTALLSGWFIWDIELNAYQSYHI